MEQMIKQELLDNEVTHRHAGNGYVVCQVIDKDFVRVTEKITPRFGSRAWLAATDRLQVSEVGPEIPDDIKVKLLNLRSMLESGKLKCKGTHIVKSD